MAVVIVLSYLNIGVFIVLTNWFRAIGEGESTLKDFLKPTQILLAVMYVVFWLPVLIGAGSFLLVVQSGKMKKVKR